MLSGCMLKSPSHSMVSPTETLREFGEYVSPNDPPNWMTYVFATAGFAATNKITTNKIIMALSDAEIDCVFMTIPFWFIM